jgi:hypothetical protein
VGYQKSLLAPRRPFLQYQFSARNNRPEGWHLPFDSFEKPSGRLLLRQAECPYQHASKACCHSEERIDEKSYFQEEF